VDRADQFAQRLGAGRDDLAAAVDVEFRQAIERDANLLLDQWLERVAVAQRVVDREADLLVVAASAEAADGLVAGRGVSGAVSPNGWLRIRTDRDVCST
jgi:hypothetical protein